MSHRILWRIWIGMILYLPVVGFAQTYPDANQFIFADKEPEPLNLAEVQSSIGYPEDARSKGIEGTVVARVLVDSTGRYIKHIMISDPDPSLTFAVAEKLSNLRFNPAVAGDKAINFWVNLPFRFKLTGETLAEIESQIDAITDSLTGDQENYQLWYRRGLLYMRKGDWEKARSDLGESLVFNPRKNKKKDPTFFKYLFFATYYRANVYSQEEAPAQAVQDYTDALAFATEMKAADSTVAKIVPSIYLERGYIQLLDSNMTAAKTDLRWVTENDEENACTAYQLLADIALGEDDKEAVVNAYTGLIECDPENILLRYSRAYYRSELGQYDEAIADFSEVVHKTEMTPILLAAHNRKGWCYLQQKQYDKATMELGETLSINVLNAQAHYIQGLIYLDQGLTNKGCESLRKALIYEIEGEEREDALEKAQSICGYEGD
ncbi:MAG: TonB family protein [Bacteroidota bacterium]